MNLVRSGLTIEVGPATADHVLDQLSPIVGQHLVCSPRLRREVLMIRVKDTSWDEIKARIAKVTWATWTKEGTDWVLERPAAIARRRTQEIIDNRAQIIRKGLAAKSRGIAPWSKGYLAGLVAKLSSLAEKSQNASRETESQARQALMEATVETPAGRALKRLIGKMDPRDIAVIGPDEMAVFSDQPTTMERRLPLDAAAILRDFLAEQQDFAREMEQRNDLYPAVDFLDPRFNIVSTNPPASRFFLTIRRFGKGNPEAVLVAADPDGWYVALAWEDVAVASEATKDSFRDFPSKPLDLSQRAKDCISIFTVVSGLYGGDIGDREHAYRLAREWMPTFSEAAKVEPMEFVIGDAIERTADEFRLNVVADLPDDLLTDMPLAEKGKPLTTDRFVREITSSWFNTTGSFKDGWLEFMPIDPATATEDRLNRSDMGRLAAAIDARKSALIDDLADYAAGQPGRLCFRSIDQAIAGTYSRSAGDTGAGLANYYYANVLRFWGSLSPPQREALRKGGSIRVSGLGEQARHWLSVYVYGIPRAFATNFVTPFTPPPWSTARRNVRASPYEGLANGIPMDSTITGRPVSEPMLRVRVKDEADQDTSTPEVLGGWFARHKWPLSGDQSPLLSVAYAYAPMVRVNFDFGRGYTAWTQIGDDAASWSKWMKYDELPADIRKRTEARYTEAAAQKAKDDAKAKARTIPPR